MISWRLRPRFNNRAGPARCKTRFDLLSGHGFNRAEYKASRRRLQPLKATHAPKD
jgi:hypothetical protein